MKGTGRRNGVTLAQVAALTLAGKSAAEIGAELQISQSGVYSARQRARALGQLPPDTIEVQPVDPAPVQPVVSTRPVGRSPAPQPQPEVEPTSFAGRAAVFARLGAVEYLQRAGWSRAEAEQEVDRIGSMAAVAGRR